MRIGMMALGLALMAGTALAQTAPQPDPEAARRMAEMRAADAKRADSPGTGPYAAIKEADPGLPDHTVYRPADLSKLGGKKLGVVIWGNGGCAADGSSARHHLAQIASYGYLVVAPGRIYSGPGALPRPADAAARGPDPATGRLPQPPTTSADVLKGLDWALAENGRDGSRYKGLIDPAQVAVAGHSCGGLQAIAAGADKRIKTVLVHNSGVFNDGKQAITGMTVDKTMLKALHTPTLYVLGGKGDVAWPNGTDDYARITHVPVALIDGDVGHGGTFREDNGGDVGRFSVAWLNWQLRGDAEAGKLFTGAECGLCKDPKWKIERKGI
jgi:dienelactone hydrolase